MGRKTTKIRGKYLICIPNPLANHENKMARPKPEITAKMISIFLSIFKSYHKFPKKSKTEMNRRFIEGWNELKIH